MRAGDRMAILDPPPGLNGQEIKDWRMNVAGYDSKFATLYWPWIKTLDPATGRPVPWIASAMPAGAR